MKLLVQKGKTSFLACIFVQDSSSTVGAGLSGLAFNTSGLVCYRARADDGNAGGTAISLATATLGTWATGGFKEKDATNMKGVYEIGVTNASLATGSDYCILYFAGATNMAPLVLEIQLVAFDPDDAVHLGLSSLPNTAVTTNASLLTSGTGTDQLSVTSGRIDAGKWLGGTIPAVNVTGVPLVDLKYTLGTISPATAGSVRADAVTGAVGSVTGNVGGSVASVTAAVAVTSNIKKNASGRLTFTMTDSTNHNPVTGKTVAGQVSIDGVAFVATNTANATEISNGDYTLALAAADTNGNALMYRFTATGCDDLNIFVLTQP